MLQIDLSNMVRKCQLMSVNGVDRHESESSQHQGPSSGDILRQINGCPGLYISWSIQGVSVEWTTDTGATKLIISKKVFEKIPN